MLKSELIYKAYGSFANEHHRLWAIRMVRAITGRHLFVRMDTNFLCNLRCTSCFFSNPDTVGKFQKAMPLEDFRRLAAHLFPRVRMLYLSCSAEPLMTKRFEEYLDEVGRYRIPLTGFVTNGTLMREEVIESAVRNRIDEITISIDGATRETFESIRIGGRWEKLLAGIELINEVKSRLRARRPALRFNFTACQSNLGELPKLIEMAARLRVSSVTVRIMENWGGTIDLAKESLHHVPSRYNAVLTEAEARARELHVDLYAPPRFELNPHATSAGCAPPTAPQDVVPTDASIPASSLETASDAAAAPAPESDAFKPYACVLPWYFGYVGPDGSYWPCFHLRDKGLAPDGNFITQDWDEIARSAGAQNRRRLLAKDPRASCLNVCDCKPNKEFVEIY